MTARRLAAIFAADIVGYSRLMGEDEADTARAVRERREAAQPIVANLGGRASSRRPATACCWNFPSSSLPSNARRVHNSYNPRERRP
jgi:class 3 adenylate cyclase